MKKFRKICLPISLVVLTSFLISGCSAQMKKSRALRRAEEYMKAGDYEKAKIEYTNALRIDPKEPEPFYQIGKIWLAEGAPLRAGPFLIRGKELAPKRTDIRTKLGEVYIAVAGFTEARKEATEALQINPQDEDALLLLSDAARNPEEVAQAEAALKNAGEKDSLKYHLSLATLALRKNNLPGMEEELKRAIAADPKSPLPHVALARYRATQNNREEAGKEFKIAAELAPPRDTAQLMYTEFQAGTGALPDAKKYLEEVLKKAPDYLPGWTLLARLTTSESYDKAIAVLDNVFRRDMQSFDARMLEADFTAAKGDSKKAVELLKQLETNYAKIPIVKVQLARALMQSGDLTQALTSADQAIQLAPTYADAILLQGEINLRLGNAPAAVTSMENFVKTNPGPVFVEKAQVILADAYRALNRFDDAANLLRQQIATNPQKAEPYLMLGVLLRQQGKTAEARENLEKAAAFAQNKLVAVNQLIGLDIEANDYAAAMQRIAPALKQFPDEPGLLFLQGKILAAQKEWDSAEASLLRVLELNANVPAVYDLLVGVYVAQHKLPQAAQQLEAREAKSPGNLGVLMTLGLIYSELKDYERARDAYEKLLALKPDNSVAANNLAYIYADQLNQLDKGRDWAAKAHSTSPNSPPISDTFGWIVFRQGDYKQAASLLKEAAEKMPNEPEVQYHWAMASYMMGDSKSARIAFETAALSPRDFPGKEEAKKRLALLKEGNASGDTSADQLEALIKQQPNDPVALAKLGEIYQQQRANDKAAEYYEQAIKANPTLPAPMLKLAEIYATSPGKNDRALELAKKARELAPHDARTSSIVGRLAFQSGNYAWAYSVLQESARQLNEPAVLRDFAWAAYANSKMTEARQNMEKLLKSAPDSQEAAEAKTFLAFTAPEVGQGSPSPSSSEIQQKLKEDPAYAPALMLQGHQLITNDQKAAATKAFAEVLKQFPDFAPAQKQLAALYLEDPSQRSKAYELASAARKALPDDPELAAVLGEASYYKKDYSRAAQLLQDSNRKRPLDASRLFFLGMSLIETKQAPQGREILQRAISQGLQEPLAGEAAKAAKPPEEKPK